jgi:5'(3')-deoxyribonucleotidase
MTATKKTPYRPVILIDCDGVLADIATPLVNEANRMVEKMWRDPTVDGLQVRGSYVHSVTRPETIRPEDLIDYDISKAFPGLRSSKVYEPLARQGFCRSLRPYPGAAAAVKRLQELGEVYCVTKPARSPYWHWEREEWLQMLMGIPRDRVIFAANKSLITGHFFIDDNQEHVWDWMTERGDGYADHPWEYFATGFVWDQPYNRKGPTPPGPAWSHPPIKRTNDWDIVIKAVEEVAK